MGAQEFKKHPREGSSNKERTVGLGEVVRLVAIGVLAGVLVGMLVGGFLVARLDSPVVLETPACRCPSTAR